jgi:hypothetical protein
VSPQMTEKERKDKGSSACRFPIWNLDCRSRHVSGYVPVHAGCIGTFPFHIACQIFRLA